MVFRSHSRTPRRRRTRRLTFKSLRRFIRLWFRAFRNTVAAYPLPIRYLVSGVIILLVWAGVNWMYQAINKPTEVFFALDDTLDKSPSETWRQYGPLFREHSTSVITPELLAALAQVEGGGNPVARTYWRWRLTRNPLGLYQPASSAVGMYQITDGTFREAKRYCIHDHVVIQDGPWQDLKSCWFNSLYSRVVPSHAIELTAALLDRNVASTLAHRRLAPATFKQKQDLAAVIHLCGAAAGNAYAAHGFRLTRNQRCGDHDVRNYLVRVNGMKHQFARLASTV
jgi:hypothetical protein